MSTRANATAPTDAGCAASNALRHVESRPLLMPYARATSVDDTPGSKLFAAIACFCSMDRRRRGSPRVISSIRGVPELIGALVRELGWFSLGLSRRRFDVHDVGEHPGRERLLQLRL